jgi:hypothetical protein
VKQQDLKIHAPHVPAGRLRLWDGNVSAGGARLRGVDEQKQWGGVKLSFGRCLQDGWAMSSK